MNLLELLCSVDDFTQTFAQGNPEKALSGTKKIRNRKLSMHMGEIMTLLIWFHM